MLTNDKFVVLFVLLFLLTATVLALFESTMIASLIMVIASPFLVVWMVYTVLKHGKYNGPELNSKEFGYLDMPDIKG